MAGMKNQIKGGFRSDEAKSVFLALFLLASSVGLFRVLITDQTLTAIRVAATKVANVAGLYRFCRFCRFCRFGGLSHSTTPALRAIRVAGGS